MKAAARKSIDVFSAARMRKGCVGLVDAWECEGVRRPRTGQKARARGPGIHRHGEQEGSL